MVKTLDNKSKRTKVAWMLLNTYTNSNMDRISLGRESGGNKWVVLGRGQIIKTGTEQEMNVLFKILSL